LAAGLDAGAVGKDQLQQRGIAEMLCATREIGQFQRVQFTPDRCGRTDCRPEPEARQQQVGCERDVKIDEVVGGPAKRIPCHGFAPERTVRAMEAYLPEN
jgi:hypothetical protein